ncbi:MAG: hypothetical protein J6Y20_00120 [Lachnospiraceae bacterium]|nr:hypothetical protein [Lachnospiraceae bacterium]
MGFFDNLKKTVTDALGTSSSAQETNPKKDITFGDIPTSLAEMKALPYADLKDPFAVAALCVCALCIFPTDQNTSIEMMNFLKGPSPLTPGDISFIKDRFRDNKEYKPRSYFKGATPDNNYMPSSPYTITVAENPYSRDNFSEGYLRLFLQSGGADSPRPLTLRTKPSTGEWFVFSDSFYGLLADIRTPAAQDPWA